MQEIVLKWKIYFQFLVSAYSGRLPDYLNFTLKKRFRDTIMYERFALKYIFWCDGRLELHKIAPKKIDFQCVTL